MTKPDPAAFFREMLGNWEGIAGQFAAELMKSGDATRAMQGASAAGAKAKEAAHDAMSRALAAANMPSREEIANLDGRMRAVEERLGRIETLLVRLAGEAPAAPSKADRKKPSKKGG